MAALARRLALLTYLFNVIAEVASVASANTSVIEQKHVGIASCTKQGTYIACFAIRIALAANVAYLVKSRAALLDTRVLFKKNQICQFFCEASIAYATSPLAIFAWIVAP